MRRIMVSFGLVPVLVALIGTGVLAAQGPQPNIAPPTVNPYGVSYERWTGRWFEWMFGSAERTSPIAHPERCTSNLHGRIWFMPHAAFGTSAKAHCTISTGTPILLSAGGASCDQSELDTNIPSELTACANAYFAALSKFRVIVDGVEVKRLERFHFVTAPVVIRYRANNLFEVPPGGYWGVVNAYVLMLRPLPAGNHTVIVQDESEGKVARMTSFFKVV